MTIATTDFAWLPSALANELQQGFLERELEEGLDSVLAYRSCAVQETIPGRIGETLTRTRKGRKAPTRTPLPVSTLNALDNGMTPSSYSIEQYSFTLQPYADTVDVDILGTEATIADDFIANSRNNGVQASQSRELISRFKLFSAYVGANTRVRSDLGSDSTTLVYVDDIRGFQNTWVNGTPIGVSGTNPITVQEYAVSSAGYTQSLTITAVAPTATNYSTTPDGVSGYLTIYPAAANTPANGDALIASYAPAIKRPSGHVSDAQLSMQDTLTLGLLQDAVAGLRSNGVPVMSDGTYHVILDDVSHRQLMADQDFKVYFASRQDSEVIKRSDVYVMLGMTFIPTTNAYVQLGGSANANGSTGASQVGVTVRRPIVLGAECLIEGNFEGMETYLSREGVTPIANTMMVDNVLQIIRPPIDRLNRFASLSWTWIGDYAVPTDLTATPSIIPTASSAAWKRACVVAHAG
jgi:hypothetical protein